MLSMLNSYYNDCSYIALVLIKSFRNDFNWNPIRFSSFTNLHNYLNGTDRLKM